MGRASANLSKPSQGSIEAGYLVAFHAPEKLLHQPRWRSDSQLDPGLGEALLRIRQSDQPGRSYELQLGEVQHHALAMQLNGGFQSSPEIERGKTLDPPMESEHSARTLER